MEVQEGPSPPLIAYNLANEVSQVVPAWEMPPLYPESYLGELTAAHGWLLEAARGNAAHIARSLSSIALFMHYSVHLEQRFALGRRMLERAVGEGATPAAMADWATMGISDGRSFAVIRALTHYVVGLRPQDAAPKRPPAPAPWQPAGDVEPAHKLDALIAGLSAPRVAYAVAAVASVRAECRRAFVGHCTGSGDRVGRTAVREAAGELGRMLDQYHARASDKLKSDARYGAVRGLVQKIIGYAGQPPQSLENALHSSPYGRTAREKATASLQVAAMLKEVLIHEVGRDPERNMGLVLGTVSIWRL